MWRSIRQLLCDHNGVAGERHITKLATLGTLCGRPHKVAEIPMLGSERARGRKPLGLLEKAFTLLCLLVSLPSVGLAQQRDSTRLQEMINHARELRALMQSDPHRPIYHFVAPEGVAMPFDPNGAIYWKGKYHLGYIYQKRPVSKRNIWSPDDIHNGHVWGHVVSTDLLHW